MLSKENYYALIEYNISFAEYLEHEWYDDIVCDSIEHPYKRSTRMKMICIIYDFFSKAYKNLSEFRKNYGDDWIFDNKYALLSERTKKVYYFICPMYSHFI